MYIYRNTEGLESKCMKSERHEQVGRESEKERSRCKKVERETHELGERERKSKVET